MDCINHILQFAFACFFLSGRSPEYFWPPWLDKHKIKSPVSKELMTHNRCLFSCYSICCSFVWASLQGRYVTSVNIRATVWYFVLVLVYLEIVKGFTTQQSFINSSILPPNVNSKRCVNGRMAIRQVLKRKHGKTVFLIRSRYRSLCIFWRQKHPPFTNDKSKKM